MARISLKDFLDEQLNAYISLENITILSNFVPINSSIILNKIKDARKNFNYVTDTLSEYDFLLDSDVGLRYNQIVSRSQDIISYELFLLKRVKSSGYEISYYDKEGNFISNIEKKIPGFFDCISAQSIFQSHINNFMELFYFFQGLNKDVKGEKNYLKRSLGVMNSFMGKSTFLLSKYNFEKKVGNETNIKNLYFDQEKMNKKFREIEEKLVQKISSWGYTVEYSGDLIENISEDCKGAQ